MMAVDLSRVFTCIFHELRVKKPSPPLYFSSSVAACLLVKNGIMDGLHWKK